MRLIYLAPVPWTSFAQRPHKFVDWFHKRMGGEVLWVDPYPTRFPLLSDFSRLKPSKFEPLVSNPSWIKILKPRALPIEPLPASGWLNHFVWKKTLRELMEFSKENKTILVVGKPSVFSLRVINSLSLHQTVYDAMDDFPAFYRGVSRIAMTCREKALVKRVSSVLTSSSLLKSRWSGLRPDVKLVHNGLDLALAPFFRGRRQDIHPKVFGYVGTIASWFDWDWLVALARAFPESSIRLIGPVFQPAPMALPGNIEFRPPCDHVSALREMADFDVGLIPFKVNKLTDSVDPIKYYEYRALGLPVLSTNFGEMSFRAGDEGVFLSKNPEGLSLLASQALQFKQDSVSTESFALNNSWDSRFDEASLV
ncbi:Glycosyltransferase involved in cell wall bisynthesis [Pseudomonas chlororaphis]|uniref:glycosyl transferase n=1 Tax=Pseudomonas chlororaphis TaxID=587753 RepID=UPI00087D16EA|nr:glycosyl transferase [Pseudomonas chlororaphis]AZD63933.1 Glycosyltransferase [Pseudomonas chlororaphis subsp. aurantiaca]AZD70407.1 Glycosyltransferase [Pseudomonas chlororaphis subsp. aurantiaca]QIT20161.1 glycosyltransferase family 1 protein [Pseudomonas chlororaphis subsp. aurantiaca]WDH04307.1 glycosyl transferase [Pseudomonas chlororaphis]WDH12938.1 glycosyl transferase [Pseudomonas chlororaphis]